LCAHACARADSTCTQVAQEMVEHIVGAAHAGTIRFPHASTHGNASSGATTSTSTTTATTTTRSTATTTTSRARRRSRVRRVNADDDEYADDDADTPAAHAGARDADVDEDADDGGDGSASDREDDDDDTDDDDVDDATTRALSSGASVRIDDVDVGDRLLLVPSRADSEWPCVCEGEVVAVDVGIVGAAVVESEVCCEWTVARVIDVCL
jgi:hypothetical protein